MSESDCGVVRFVRRWFVISFVVDDCCSCFVEDKVGIVEASRVAIPIVESIIESIIIFCCSTNVSYPVLLLLLKELLCQLSFCDFSMNRYPFYSRH